MRLGRQNTAHCSQHAFGKQLIPCTRASLARRHSVNGTGTTETLAGVAPPASSTPSELPSSTSVPVKVSEKASDNASAQFTTWSVSLKTYVPASIKGKKLDNLGIDLKVISRSGAEIVLPPLKVVKTVSYPRKHEFLQGRIDYFSIDLPAYFEDPAFTPVAVSVNDRSDAGDTLFRKNQQFEQVFLERIILTPYNNRRAKLSFTANSHISVTQDWRLFMRDDAWTNKELREDTITAQLQENELAELRGEGSNVVIANTVPRHPGDRIYRFAPYNDLGKNPVIPDDIRPTLGGSDFPYPRRLDTNRPLWPESQFETPPTTAGATQQLDDAIGIKPVDDLVAKVQDTVLPSPWVPEDDNFDTDKDTGFLGSAVLGILPSVLTQVDDALDSNPRTRFVGNILERKHIAPGEEFDRIDEVLGLYGKEGLELTGDKNSNPGHGFLEKVGRLAAIFNPRTGKAPEEKDAGTSADTTADIRADIEASKDASSDDGISADIRADIAAGRDAGISADINASTNSGKDAGVFANIHATVTAAKSAIKSAGKDAGKSGLIDLFEYTVPRSLNFSVAGSPEVGNRFKTWFTDQEFGRMFLAGLNPLVIEAVNTEADLKHLLKGTSIQEAEIKEYLEGHSYHDLVNLPEPRLFVVDYTALYDLLPEIDRAADGKPIGVQHAGRALFFKNKDGLMKPVAIELAYSNSGSYTVYTPKDPPNIWLLAKVLFMSIDSGYHQLYSHFVRTHASVEPYLISTRRRLSPTHPIFRLLMPHFRYTLPINAAARSLLINAGGVIETNFTPGPYSMALSSQLYKLNWQFKDEGLVADLRKRGFLPKTGTTAANLPLTATAADLRLKDYPYAQDGLDIWTAMHDYFTEYVNYYYAEDEDVKTDKMLNAWYKDVQDEGHPDAPKEGWIKLDGRASLVDICCTMAWVASAHHAAVNFGQYDYSGWMVTHASLCRKPAPAKDSQEWKALEKATKEDAQKLMLSWLSPPANATKVMSTVKLLSSHAADEHYLSSDEQDWLPLEDDANVRSIFSRFVKRMEVVESIIQARNQDPQYITRDPKKDGLPYTLLIPGSDAGVTMRGVPYSISIQMVSLIDMAWGFAGFMRSVQGSVYTERFGSPAAQGPAHDSCSVQP